ncbi:MAG: hypothetical protein AAGA50_27805 [Pseudomonadota bacterium]
MAKAHENGLLDGLDEIDRENVPVFVPVEIAGPGGSRLRITSLIGQLASVQDAVIEGMTIEMMVPMDAASENCLLETGKMAPSINAAE